MPRGSFVVNRISDEQAGYSVESGGNLSPWLQRVMDQIAKKQQTAVQQARGRQSVIHEVNRIMSRPQRYATVDDAVQDMQERTGLKGYLQRIDASEKARLKSIVASIQGGFPDSLQHYDCEEEITTYIKNIIDSMHGLVSVPQIQNDLVRTFGYKYNLQPQDVWNDEVAKFISNLIENSNVVNVNTIDRNIGKNMGINEDYDYNNDYFASLEPTSR